MDVQGGDEVTTGVEACRTDPMSSGIWLYCYAGELPIARVGLPGYKILAVLSYSELLTSKKLN